MDIRVSSSRKTIRCKWLYKIKYNSDGTIERYKAQLLVLCNKHVARIYYNSGGKNGNYTSFPQH